MKALIVVNVAGFLHFLWNDISSLQQLGCEVSVAMNGKMPDGTDAVEIERLNKKGIKHYQIDFNSKNPLAKTNFIAYRQLRRVLKNQYDLIHCHTPIAGCLTRLGAKKYRKKGTVVLYTTHGFTFTDRSPKKTWLVYYTIETFMSRWCDVIITINHEDYRNAQKMHCKEVYIIPSVGVNNRQFQNVQIDRDSYRKQFGISNTDIMVLAVGELSARKNHQIIIKALALLPDKERYVFVICGRALADSTIKTNLRELAEKLKVRICLPGHRLDIPEINTCADIAVIPSLREGFGMAGVEAMAAGVPVVGSDVQGIREYVVPGETGYLCNPKSAREFSEAIRKLAELTPEERMIVSSNCKKKAEEFDLKKSQSAVKEIYLNVLTKKKYKKDNHDS